MFVMIAYHLMALFRTFVLQEKTQKTLSTLRYRTFAVGAYFQKINDKIVLKLPSIKNGAAGIMDSATILNCLIFRLYFLMRNLG